MAPEYIFRITPVNADPELPGPGASQLMAGLPCISGQVVLAVAEKPALHSAPVSRMLAQVRYEWCDMRARVVQEIRP